MIEINNKTRSKIDIELIKRTTERFLKYYKKKEYEISIAFVGDCVMRRLNKEYRKRDRPTDVLSFKEEENKNFKEEKKYLGEIVIDYAQIKRQAKKYSKNVKDELIFILVHGLLHLIGYNDNCEKDRLKMIKLGHEFIGKKIKN